jgi:NADH:ubiquinone oxidoreductase subunit 2 (subunit N)
MHGGFLLVSDVLSFQIYLITYVLSMAVVGLVLTSARVNGQEVVYVSDLSRGVGALPAVFVLAFFIAMLSVSGIPPLAGF